MKKFLSVFCTMMLIFSLVACSSSDEEGNTNSIAQTNDSNQLVIGLTNDITSLDPAQNYTISNFQVVNSICDSILLFDHEGSLQPNLAKSWECKDDVTYVYTFRDDVKFSDGSNLTMDDVIFSMERIMDPATAAETNWAYASVESVEQTGDWEITVHLTEADALWQYIPATSGGQIISKEYCEKAGTSFGNADGGVMGTGAYKYVSWTTGSEVVLEKNEYYWGGAEDIPFTTVKYNVIEDASSMAMAITSNQCNFAISPSLESMSIYEGSDSVYINKEESVSNTMISFNCQSAPFDDVNVRRAVSCAIDSVSIRTSLWGDYATDSTSLPFGKKGYLLDTDLWTTLSDTIESYSYDIERAKEYLAQSGYADGFSCTLTTLNSSTYNSIAQAIQYSLKELNIDLTIKQVTTSEYYAYAYGSMMTDGIRDYDMMINRWTPDYMDPAGFLLPQYITSNAGEGGSNYAAYSNTEVDELALKQSQSVDNAERSNLMIEAYKIIADEAPYKMICYPDTIAVMNTKYYYEISPIWIYNFHVKDITLK